jgi:hypothetical protein
MRIAHFDIMGNGSPVRQITPPGILALRTRWIRQRFRVSAEHAAVLASHAFGGGDR